MLRKNRTGLFALALTLASSLCFTSCAGKAEPSDSKKSIDVTMEEENYRNNAEETDNQVQMINYSEKLMGMTNEEILDSFDSFELNGVLEYPNGTYGLPDNAAESLGNLISEMAPEDHFTIGCNAEAMDSYVVYLYDKECNFDCIALFDKNDGSLADTNIYNTYKDSVTLRSVKKITDGTLDIEGFDIGFPSKMNDKNSSTFGTYELTIPDVEVLCNEAKQDTVDTMYKIEDIVKECDPHGIMKNVEVVRGYGKPSQRLIDMGFAKEGEPEFELPGISAEEADAKRLQRLYEDMENGNVTVSKGLGSDNTAASSDSGEELGSIDTNASIPAKHKAKKAGNKRSGDYKYGYVDIPESYSSFKDISSGDNHLIKCLDSDEMYGVVMAYFPETYMSYDEAIKTFTEAFIEPLESEGIKVDSTITDVMIDHGEYSGVKYMAVSEVEIVQGVYFFKGNEGYVHMIQVLSDTEEHVNEILDSYSLTDIY